MLSASVCVAACPNYSSRSGSVPLPGHDPDPLPPQKFGADHVNLNRAEWVAVFHCGHGDAEHPGDGFPCSDELPVQLFDGAQLKFRRNPTLGIICTISSMLTNR